MMINMTDPNGELAWLINELQDAEDKGDKVLDITYQIQI